MTVESKKYQRDFRGLSELTWDMIEKVANGDKDFDVRRAEVVIKGAEVIIKGKMAEIAADLHQEKIEKMKRRVINAEQQALPHKEVQDGGDARAAEEEVARSADEKVEEGSPGETEAAG